MAVHRSIVPRGPVLPIDVAQLVMDALYDASSPEDHCYRNQHTYRNWSLVCRGWRMYAQSLLFRIVELNDPASLRRFSAHLDSAPHLAHYVREAKRPTTAREEFGRQVQWPKNSPWVSVGQPSRNRMLGGEKA